MLVNYEQLEENKKQIIGVVFVGFLAGLGGGGDFLFRYFL